METYTWILQSIIAFIIGLIVGGKIVLDDFKKKVKAGMTPFIGRTGDIEWGDDDPMA